MSGRLPLSQRHCGRPPPRNSFTKSTNSSPRRRIVTLTPRGRRDYDATERQVAGTAEFMLQLLPPADLDRMMAAMKTIETILRDVYWDDIR